MTKAEYFKSPPPPSFTNRLFGTNPDGLDMPFCALSPTVSCSTSLVALVLRHARAKDPEVGLSDVSRDLVKAWSLLRTGKIGNRAEVCGVTVKMLPLLSKGSIWSHAPVHAPALGGEPPRARAETRGVTEATIANHPGKAGSDSERKAEMEEKVMQDVAQAAETVENEEAQDRWPRVKFPNAFVHPYSMTDQNGKEWQKAICTIPDGVKVNGVDLSGFALDTFMKDFHMEQKTLGKPVILALNPKEPVTLFKGKGDERAERKVMAWDLTKSMAKHAREFKEKKQAEREAKNPSLEETASRPAAAPKVQEEQQHMRNDPVR